MLITKADGTQEEFNVARLRESLSRAGAERAVIDKVVEHVQQELSEGMTTTEIYKHAYQLLKKEGKPLAARYSLKRAVMEMGPSGFPFESLLAELFKRQGYETRIGTHLEGKCVSHEVDVVAQNSKEYMVMEAKFHNRPGFKTDVKTALYVNARCLDLREAAHKDVPARGRAFSGWLITNTKFTRNAIAYGKCSGLRLLGWSYPHKHNLQHMIEEAGLHPLTCLTTLTKAEKKRLFDKRVVLCRDLRDGAHLRDLGIHGKKQEGIMEEIGLLCKPYNRG